MNQPVFIHSFFRAGSTYLFKVFRRSANTYWCYQEPLHEVVLAAKEQPDQLLKAGSDLAEVLRHPNMEKPYHFELYEVAAQCIGSLEKEHIYDNYFALNDDDFGLDFWRALIAAARGTPVIQECRTSSRVGAIKEALGGCHVYLWRNPWDQWWSLKVVDYFSAATQLCINGKNHPEVIGRLRHEVGFRAYSNDDPFVELNWFLEHPLSPENSYLVFYVLWLLGLQEGLKHADVMLNIDRLSDDPNYRQEIALALSSQGIEGIDFSDCSVPQSTYGDASRAFFARVEDKAHGLFLLAGYKQSELEQLLHVRSKYQPKLHGCDAGRISQVELIRDIERARSVVLNIERTFCERVSFTEQNLAEARRVSGEQLEVLSRERANAEENRDRLTAELAFAREQLQRQEAQLDELRNQLSLSMENSNRWYLLLEKRSTEVEHAQHRLGEVQARADYWHQQAEQRAVQVQMLMSSTSWRITSPIRVLRRGVNLISGRRGSVGRGGAVLAARAAVSRALRKPRVRRRIEGWSRKYPAQYVRIRGIYRRFFADGPSMSPVQPRHGAATVAAKADAVGFLPAFEGGLTPEQLRISAVSAGRYAGKRVAVLAPQSAPGIKGGAERFYAELVQALRGQGCEVELICSVVDESGFETIQSGYRHFEQLDVSRFDAVISTKAPAYAVQHNNHILYLVHTIRVFYDMFDDVFSGGHEALLAQRKWIHERDNQAFSGVQARFAIGAEVAGRLKKWNACDAEVLHPPVHACNFYDLGIGDYFYMPGRLHDWKRVDLAIQAIKCSSLPMKLLISGDGEAEAKLRKIADDDSRITFLGRVSEEELRRLYAGALAVPFLPIREDYGYVTLEAFASGKPVVTCIDSGEPATFVEHGGNGLVCRPEPEAIREAFELLWNDRAFAAKLGRAGREKARCMDWELVAGRLLGAAFPELKTSPVPRTRLKVAVLDMQPMVPAVGGGRLRLLGLYHALGVDTETRYLGTYDWPGENYRRHFVTPTLEEINVPLSEEHHAAAAAAAGKAGGRVVIDMLFGQQGTLSPEYLAEAIETIKWADVVVFSHPWVAPLVDDELLVDKVVVYDSHNVELRLREQLLDRKNAFEQKILEEVERAETMAGSRADLILACSDEDAQEFTRTYGWSRARILVVPNGVFVSSIKAPNQEDKQLARRELNIEPDRVVAFFIGSNYAPNIEAANVIIDELAPSIPGVEFIIAGGVCEGLSKVGAGNVRLVGFVNDRQKANYLHAADIAINPMASGSGTNIKMFDFMAAGLPIVSTAIGARGITDQSIGGIHLADPGEMARTVEHLISDKHDLIALGKWNRELAESKYAWESMSPELGMQLRSRWLRKKGGDILAKKLKAPRVAHLTTMGIKCGVGEYTRNIVNIYKQHGVDNLVLTCESPSEAPELDSLGVEARLSWYFDNELWARSRIDSNTVEQVIRWGGDAVLVQYHPGYYSPETLYLFVEDCIGRDLAVAVVVHNFTELCAGVMARLNDLGVILFSHRASEVQQAREQGVRLELMPLGVEFQRYVARRDISCRDFSKRPPVIVTNGFLRWHKCTRNLVKAMPEILERFPGAHLLVQSPLYSSEDSRDELSACQNEIERYRLSANVTMDTSFLDKARVLEKMAQADLAVLPYEESNEGSSASAMDALAVGLPLVVSAAEIFDGIRDIVVTSNSDPESIARAVIDILSVPHKYNELAEASFDYANENEWSRVAGAYLAALV